MNNSPNNPCLLFTAGFLGTKVTLITKYAEIAAQISPLLPQAAGNTAGLASRKNIHYYINNVEVGRADMSKANIGTGLLMDWNIRRD